MDEDWALCVGISHYPPGSGLDQLGGAKVDAEEIYKWITDSAGGDVPQTQADLILSPAGGGTPFPAEHQIEKFLHDRYLQAAKSLGEGNGFRAGRRLWLYYSGHGMGFSEDEYETGLLTADAQPDYYYPHVAGMAWANAFRVSKAFDEVILIMDCCRLEANGTTLRRPAVRQLKRDPKGKIMAVYAVSEGKAAFETKVDGIPRGNFTYTLEKLLKNPGGRPASAREFLDRLERDFPGCAIIEPRSRSGDFELLPAARQAPSPGVRGGAPAPDLLVLHGETTAALAPPLADALKTNDRKTGFDWAIDVLSEDVGGRDFGPVKELVITRAMRPGELRGLMDRVQPERAVIMTSKDPPGPLQPGIRFIKVDENAGFGTLENAKILRDTFAGWADGKLTVSATGPVANKIQIWDARGHLIGQGFGSAHLNSVPEGEYTVRASLGSHHLEARAEVRSGKPTRIELPDLSLQLPSANSLVSSEQNRDAESGESGVYKLHSDNFKHFFSPPTIEGWRTEVFALGTAGSGIYSIRLVRDFHPTGEYHPLDLLREGLRLALAEPHYDPGDLDVLTVAEDPVCALLAAALCLKWKRPHQKFTDAAAALLGERNPDVRLLRGAATLETPPLLSLPWHLRISENQLEAEEGSPADQIVGRLLTTAPWLMWVEESEPAKDRLLTQVATAVWPGWDTSPDSEIADQSLIRSSTALGAPLDSINRKIYKSPPVKRLSKHDRISFVGASNDQLLAALAVAFVDRKKKKWQRLDVWSLSDTWLVNVGSDGRSSEQLIAARDEAEDLLHTMLKQVAHEWSIVRYEGFEVNSQWYFASLWDWTEKGGVIHVSPYKKGENVRTTSFDDLEWSKEAPPDFYKAASLAFSKLSPSKVLHTSGATEK